MTLITAFLPLLSYGEDMGRHEHPSNNANQLALATLEQCFVLAGIHQGIQMILEAEGLTRPAYYGARDAVERVLTLPPYDDCRFTIYRQVGRRTHAEFGGGIQVEFTRDTEFLGAQDYGVRVPVYARDATRVLPADSFTAEDATIVVRQIEQLALLRDTRSLSLAVDLSRIALSGADDRIILEPIQAW